MTDTTNNDNNDNEILDSGLSELLTLLNTLHHISALPFNELEEYYDEYITINFNHVEVKIPFEAISCNALMDLLLTIIKENYSYD